MDEWTYDLVEKIKEECSKSRFIHEWPSSCVFLCFYHRRTGVVRVPKLFWTNSLRNEFEYWKNNPDIVEDRLMEHAHAFYGYSIIPSQIESILEIGAGPFTQIQYLITPFRHINSITILEPNAISYMKLNNCKYKGGHLKGHSIEIISDSIESFMEKQRKLSTTNHKLYSIVVAINVVEHVQDAIEYFHAIYNLIEINGLVIFHERWFDHPRDGDCVLEDAERLHPIRITKFVIDIFLNQFETLFINYNKTLRQQKSVCKEQGVYFIGRKTK
ncbi:unnamed protein product [Didymodactylos carnosus]|uniref:Methyltransferase type 12 domain-containing protein n=1 Tax=Didymodactylos carnosus TaxID=1234261 RepID=A0A814ECG3_9BILA|nr:unnamed protein product [Didymodactylos carnosus]CAF3738279.1 unnamed protein product [Didymodactylos carnosus]